VGIICVLSQHIEQILCPLGYATDEGVAELLMSELLDFHGTRRRFEFLVVKTMRRRVTTSDEVPHHRTHQASDSSASVVHGTCCLVSAT
jgi:hypothetical protein